MSAEIRTRSLATLDALGFKVASSLPHHDGTLRPLDEVARRLMALDVVFTWVTQLQIDEAKVRRFADRHDLEAWMTDVERATWALPRETAHEEHVDLIGWRLENMWPLAWVLGFERVPTVDGAMIDTATIEALFAFGPKTPEIGEDVRARAPDPIDVLALADLFYCAHNAARSAQLGGHTVPSPWHPVVSGGVIHERRHALTWATSPGVAWADTDLST